MREKTLRSDGTPRRERVSRQSWGEENEIRQVFASVSFWIVVARGRPARPPPYVSSFAVTVGLLSLADRDVAGISGSAFSQKMRGEKTVIHNGGSAGPRSSPASPVVVDVRRRRHGRWKSKKSEGEDVCGRPDVGEGRGEEHLAPDRECTAKAAEGAPERAAR